MTIQQQVYCALSGSNNLIIGGSLQLLYNITQSNNTTGNSTVRVFSKEFDQVCLQV